MYLYQLFLLALATFHVVALKGSNRRSLRVLQGGLPVAPPSTEKQMPPPPLAKKDPGPAPKDKKAKKCKTAKMAPPASNPPVENGGRNLITEESGSSPQMEPLPPMEEEYCLHGDVTEEQCLAARSGKLPKDHQKIQGDVSIDITYDPLSKASDVLGDMTEILRTKTAADFIGCDSARRRLPYDGNMTHDDHPMGPLEMEDREDLQVTGVDFSNPKIKTAECRGMNDSLMVCDTISSIVHIYFQGGNASNADEMEMFALLITTIQEQAREGSFRDIANVESVSLTSSISNATDSGGSNDVAQTVGIPTGLVGGVLILAAGALLGYCCLCRGRDDGEDDKQKDEDIIVAEAIVVENEEEEDAYHKKKSKTRFL